jgi:peptide/nickel transport system substrate-binding protein
LRASPRQLASAIAVLAVTTVLGACSSAGGSASGGAKPASGGVATIAETPGNSADYIFPFFSIQYASTSNTTTFQSLMYRPLYWFGTGASPAVNDSLSLADQPQWSSDDKAVTIDLKDYHWSDGTRLTPEDVAFWIGLDRSEKQNWAFYSAGYLPDDLSSVSYDDSANSVTFHLKAAVSPTFFLYDELSQITPLPLAWDVTAPGHKGSCASEQPAQQQASCPQVYSYLAAQAKDQATYATSPLWKVVDGPFTLSTYAAGGEYTMVPNKSYSGPVKPRLSGLKFLPFTTDTAEYNELRSGTAVSVGYIPAQDLPPKPVSQPAGRNPVTGYAMYPVNYWGFQYLLINFNNPTVGPLLKQLYVRQVLQSLVDQNVDVEKAYNGYGYAGFGPVPKVPANPFIDPFESKNPYPFSISAARRRLQSHGWTVPAAGTAYCSHPGAGAGECGAGVSAGEKLQLKLESYSGSQSLEEVMEQFVSDAGQAGVAVTLDQVPVHQMLADAVQCTPAQPACGWQLINYGGVVYSSAFPSGQPYFATGAGQNIGSYSSPVMDNLITQTVRSSSPTAMSNYENYAAEQIPVIWQPFSSYPIEEVVNNLHGVVPFNPLLFINPENWYFTR